MSPHLVSLLHRSWTNLMHAIGTTTFGVVLFCVCVPIVAGVVLSVFAKWFQKQTTRQALVKAAEAGGVTFIASWIVVMASWLIFVGPTIFMDHQELVAANKQLRIENKQLKDALTWHTHNLSTTDPVFPNIIYMLQAFEEFKRDMNAPPPQPGQPYCVLYMTWQKHSDSAALGMMMHQLGGPLTGCAPFASAGDPDTDPELLEGADGDAIKVHAREGERAADGLFSSLGNQIHLERSYRMFRHPEKRWGPYSPQQHVVWLQFGNNVKWNSERIWNSKH